jgi:hypothetical protein
MRSASLLMIKIRPLVQKSLKTTELDELKPLDLRYGLLRQKQDNQSAIKYEYDMDRQTNNPSVHVLSGDIVVTTIGQRYKTGATVKIT